MFKNFVIEFPSCSDVYALINGELTACKVLHVTADTESCKSFVCCESPDGFKNSFKVDELYASVTDYEKGKTVTAIKPELNALIPGCYEMVKQEDNAKFFKKFYWAMVDGEPTKVYINAKRIQFDAKTRQATDIALPAEFYSSREECIKWNDINIVEADGTKRVQKSVLRSLVIDDKQRAIIDELKAVFEKAKAAGISIGYNHDWMEWIAVNKTDYPEMRYDWSDSICEEESKGAIWVSDHAIHNRLRIDLPAPAYVTECDRVIVLKPAE